LEAENAFNNLAVYTRILTSILASGSLEVHLNVLRESGALGNILPNFEAISTYKSEAVDLNIDLKYNEGTGLPSASDSEDGYASVGEDESSG